MNDSALKLNQTEIRKRARVVTLVELCKEGSLEDVVLKLQDTETDVNQLDSRGCTPLLRASQRDDPDAPDPAAPKMTWVHWVLYNIPPGTAGLAEGASDADLPPGERTVPTASRPAAVPRSAARLRSRSRRFRIRAPMQCRG